MKISNETLTILKNFSQINTGILFKQGNKLSTVSPQRNILAQANIEEDIPQDFGIFDLNNFLSVMSLFKNGAELDFDDKHVFVKGMSGRSQIKYRFTEPSMIFDERNLNIINNNKNPAVTPNISFTLTQTDFEWIMRTSNVLGSPHISVESNGEEVMIVSFDLEDDSAHTNSMLLPNVSAEGHEFKLIFKTEHLRIVPRDYYVEIDSKGVSKFSDGVLSYWITLETGSKYN